MSKLSLQLHRLYAADPSLAPAEPGELALVDAHGLVRAMVLQWGAPADWPRVSAVWQQVQSDLDLPAPAIAVNGEDAYQLWFSLQDPVPAEEATAFLAALRQRHAPGHAQQATLRWMPATDMDMACAPAPIRVPAQQTQTEQWSAIVAPDLAPMFADTPWLDLPPSADGQAELLSHLGSITPKAFQAALLRLRAEPSATSAPEPDARGTGSAGACTDPHQFLLAVMNDDSLAWALRIDAAKALLPFAPSAQSAHSARRAQGRRRR